jgi:ribosome-binding factor A
MSERTRKVSSLIHQIAAAELAQLPDSARLTVTGVEVAPDLRHATVWIGVLEGGRVDADKLFAVAVGARDDLQRTVAARLTTKFVPRLKLERDVSGEYADKIGRLIKGL